MGENKNEKKSSDETKKNNVTVVLKADLHCEGCATKFIKCIRSFHGVETVSMEEDGKKITVVGNVDPVKLREKVERKTHKKVELLSPLPNKNNNNNKENNHANEGGPNKDNNKQEEKKNESKDKQKQPDQDQKSKDNKKEPPVTTAVFKVHLHCEGCIHKIYKTVTKTHGYKDMKFDKQKDNVTVTGSMDMKVLAERLQKQLKRNVEMVTPKKDGDKKENVDKTKNDGGNEKMEGNKMQAQFMHPSPSPFVYGPGDQFSYNPYSAGQFYHAPQMFSDENPNACRVM